MLEIDSVGLIENTEDINFNNSVNHYSYLGYLLQKKGNLKEAIAAFEKALELNPDMAEIHHSLGELFAKSGEFERAKQSLEKSISLEPSWQSYCELAAIFHRSGKLKTATELYNNALNVNPDNVNIYVDLGNVLRDWGKLATAQRVFEKVIAIDPQHAVGYNNLGCVFQSWRQVEIAQKYFQKALELKPGYVDALMNTALCFKEQRDLDRAEQTYHQVLSINPDHAVAKLELCMSRLPIIYSNQEEIELRRQQYQQYLEQLAHDCQSASPEEKVKLTNMIGLSQPYFLAYQGQSDRDLQKIYGDMNCQLMAHRYPQWSQSISMPNVGTGEKIRIGFVSGYFYNHSVWKIPMKGWVENLNTSEFELFGYYTNTIQDAETVSAAKTFDKFVQEPLKAEQWADLIRNDNLHVLIYPEFGMDPMTVKLGCLKLAPVQVAFGGHPETSGLPTIDYHLSSDLMEPDDAQDHYTETLVRLPNMAVQYTLLDIVPQQRSRQDIGLSDDDIMFWCCQALYKYLPQHDDVFPRIAQALPKSKFVFIESSHGTAITTIFRQRLEGAFAELELNYNDYCVFIPRMKSSEFAGTVALADIFLDSIGWSGNNTAMESTAYNLPIVTFPGKMMRGRHVKAILTMMGIEETIASSKDDYVQIAVRLGSDLEYRQHMSQRVAQNKHKLYDDPAPVRALEEFLFQVVGKSRSSQAALVDEGLRSALQAQRQGQFAQAKQLYLQVLGIQPNHPEALLALGILAQQAEQWPEAEQYLSAATYAQPSSLKAWFALGNLLQSQGQLAGAVEAYRHALTLRPDAVSIYNNLGYTLQQQDEWEEAIACYQKALDIQPGCIEAEANLGNALHETKQLPADLCAKYASANYVVGMTCKQKGHLDAAVTYFRKAVTLEPTLVEAQLELGIYVRDQQGQFDQALEYFNHAQASIEPRKNVPVALRKAIRQELGQTYEQRIKLYPDRADAQLDFGVYLRDGKQALDEALVYLNRAKNAQPTWAKVYRELGRTYQLGGQLDLAVEAFREYISLVNPLYAEYPEQSVESVAEHDLSQYHPPAIPFDTMVTVGDYEFPAIAPVSEGRNRPFWSVVIPAVNRPEYVPECLASVLAQWTGHTDMEIVVLDNGSTTPMFDIVNTLGKGIVRYYRFPETVPLQENWNTVVALSRGHWVHLLHHDDYVLPGFYSTLQKSLSSCPDSVGAAFTGYAYTDEIGNVLSHGQFEHSYHRGVARDWVNEIGFVNTTSPPSLVIRRDAYEKLGGYKLDILYTCDWELYKRVASFYHWWHEPKVLAHYRQQNNSVTIAENMKGASGYDHLRAIEISESYLPSKQCEEITTKARENYFFWCLKKANIPLKAGNIEGAFHLIQAAIEINNSSEAIAQLFHWLDRPEAQVLRMRLAPTLHSISQF